MLLNPVSVLEGDAVIWAFPKGIGTRDEEKGVAPVEKGTLGLFVSLSGCELLPNNVTKDPEKKRDDCEELVVMDDTSADAPESPPNGGADQDEEPVSQTATAGEGEVNCPPTQTFFCESSQKIACSSPLGPPEPSAANDPDEESYDATLFAEVPPIEEKLPAM